VFRPDISDFDYAGTMKDQSPRRETLSVAADAKLLEQKTRTGNSDDRYARQLPRERAQTYMRGKKSGHVQSLVNSVFRWERRELESQRPASCWTHLRVQGAGVFNKDSEKPLGARKASATIAVEIAPWPRANDDPRDTPVAGLDLDRLALDLELV
jgi:hypothetical protein